MYIVPHFVTLHIVESNIILNFLWKWFSPTRWTTSQKVPWILEYVLTCWTSWRLLGIVPLDPHLIIMIQGSLAQYVSRRFAETAYETQISSVISPSCFLNLHGWRSTAESSTSYWDVVVLIKGGGALRWGFELRFWYSSSSVCWIAPPPSYLPFKY